MGTRSEHRAGLAEASITARFAGPLLGVPGTWLAANQELPGRRNNRVAVPPSVPWNYWWQAHYLDAIVDAAHRCLRAGDRKGARSRALLGHRLVLTIRLHNGGKIVNQYFDDMAWLAIAVQRLRVLDGLLRHPGWAASLHPVSRALAGQLAGAGDPAGGLYWNKERNFRNAPATAPAAILAARDARLEVAAPLAEWLWQELRDPKTGLIRDGIHDSPTKRLVAVAYTYNQGTTLASLLALGDELSLQRAGELIGSVANHMAQPSGALSIKGSGDGGLFTGIAIRYLAEAVQHPGLPEQVRREAARMVAATAEKVWERRYLEHGVVHFWASGKGVGQLSTQLQAWTILEANTRVR